MTQDTSPLFLQFAGAIGDIAFENDLDYNAIFTGLAIATASFLLDFSSDDNQTIDQAIVDEAVTAYGAELNRAIKFAQEQLAQAKSEDPETIVLIAP